MDPIIPLHQDPLNGDATFPLHQDPLNGDTSETLHQEPQRTTPLHQDPLNGDNSETLHQEPQRTTPLHQDPLNGDNSETPHQEYTPPNTNKLPQPPPNHPILIITAAFKRAIMQKDIILLDAYIIQYLHQLKTNVEFLAYDCSNLNASYLTAKRLLTSLTASFTPLPTSPPLTKQAPTPSASFKPHQDPLNGDTTFQLHQEPLKGDISGTPHQKPQSNTPLYQDPPNGDTSETPHQEYTSPPSPPDHPIRTFTKWFLEATKKNNALDIRAINQLFITISRNDTDFVRYDCAALCYARRTAIDLLNSHTNMTAPPSNHDPPTNPVSLTNPGPPTEPDLAANPASPLKPDPPNNLEPPTKPDPPTYPMPPSNSNPPTNPASPLNPDPTNSLKPPTEPDPPTYPIPPPNPDPPTDPGPPTGLDPAATPAFPLNPNPPFVPDPSTNTVPPLNSDPPMNQLFPFLYVGKQPPQDTIHGLAEDSAAEDLAPDNSTQHLSAQDEFHTDPANPDQ